MSESERTQDTKPAHHPWVYLNGEMIAAQQALLPVTTQAFNYGTGVFEGIRGYANADGNSINLFRLEEHIARLICSASLLRIDNLPEPAEIAMLIRNLLQRNDIQGDCYIRPLAFKQHLLPGSSFGVKLSGVSSGFAINSLSMKTYIKQQGLRCTLSNWRRVADNAIPARAKITGSYVNSALAMEAAQRGGYDDALLLNAHGNVAEATTANIFMVKKGRLITPPVSAHILEGITRDSVLTLAEDVLNLRVEERDILPSELLTAEECFLSGTGLEIAPVIQIDHHALKSMESKSITLAVKNIYQKIVRGELQEYQSWLTSVY